MIKKNKLATQTPAEVPTTDYHFILKLMKDWKISLDVSKDSNLNINEIIGVALHMVFDSSRKVMETLFEEHKELTEPEKEQEKYNMLTYCVVSAQVLVFNVMEEVFGAYDKERLQAEINKAQWQLEQFVLKQVEKASQVQDKVIKDLENGWGIDVNTPDTAAIV